MLTDIWNWLNGNKTSIGAFLLALSIAPFMPEGSFQEALMWIGTFLGGVGGAHKVVKGLKNKGVSS